MPTSDTTSESTTSAQPAGDPITPHPHDPIAEQPPMLSNLAYANAVNNVNLAQQNAVSNQQALNELSITVVGKAVNFLSGPGYMPQAVLQSEGTGAHALPSTTNAQSVGKS